MRRNKCFSLHQKQFFDFYCFLFLFFVCLQTFCFREKITLKHGTEIVEEKSDIDEISFRETEFILLQ